MPKIKGQTKTAGKTTRAGNGGTGTMTRKSTTPKATKTPRGNAAGKK